MTMKIAQLRTYWDAGEAHTVIEFLDELRDLLWTIYSDEIIAMHQDSTDEGANDIANDGQIDLEFDDEIGF